MQEKTLETNSAKSEGFPFSAQMIVRDNLLWYKKYGSDHGDLVIAEETILNTFRELIQAREKKVVEEIKEKLEMCTNDYAKLGAMESVYTCRYLLSYLFKA